VLRRSAGAKGFKLKVRKKKASEQDREKKKEREGAIIFL